MQTTTDTRVTAGERSAIERFFGGGRVDVPGLAQHLDALADAERAAVTSAMTPSQQARLYDAAKGFRPLTLDHFVPQGTPPLTQVVHAGKNSIPLFSHFEKRFCRPDAGAGRLWGYNQNPRAIQSVTGPGYFVVYTIGDGEVLIDYCEVPTGKPDAWPAVVPNSAGFSRFIYNRTKDTMRGVSNHVSIGRAARDGKVMDNWFVLCRRD
jgi:hypothetical protein